MVAHVVGLTQALPELSLLRLGGFGSRQSPSDYSQGHPQALTSVTLGL